MRHLTNHSSRSSVRTVSLFRSAHPSEQTAPRPAYSTIDSRHREFDCCHRIASVSMILLLIVCGGCSHHVAIEEPATIQAASHDDALRVAANQEWTETAVNVRAGETLTVVAAGEIVARCSDRWGHGQQTQVGPAGTYFVNDGIANQQFPLPAGAHGPAPCYALIGRIGEGEPFFVGQRRSWVAKQTGALQLGINDFDVTENTGQFLVEVQRPQSVQPVAFEQTLASARLDSIGPAQDCAVVIFYIDGLRPDVVREMAAMGHIPTIKKHFLDGGTWLSNTFTAFPSDTITSNGTMWTGCFSDRHGLKGQVRFSRRKLKSESYLENLGPSRSSRLLSPQGIDRLVQNTQARTLKTLRGEEYSQQWVQSRTTNIPPLYEHLRFHGSDWATGVLPLMTEIPPLLWTRSMTRSMPYLQAQIAWKYMDDANTLYAVRHLLERQQPVTIIWLPETDSVSHKKCRGQFGLTRRTISQADRLIAHVVDELKKTCRLDSTYLMLISDHGHHGGRTTHLSHFDVANELFHRPREMTKDGRWVGGGLGLSVGQHRYWNRHRDHDKRAFVFIDGQSDGVARIFLPKGAYHSNDWSEPNSPAELLSYCIEEHLPKLNWIETLTGAAICRGEGRQLESPIDLVLMKLADNAILIGTSDRGYAVIDRRCQNSKWFYRYQVVDKVHISEAGDLAYDAVDTPTTDPLQLVGQITTEGLKSYYDEQTWLDVTAKTDYPDSVVCLTRHMLWQDSIRGRETEFAPDLVITARRGWYFGQNSSPGTMHGYPFADAMRASWFVNGPNVRQGTRIDAACRLVDLTPTILQMVGLEPDASFFDGSAVTSIYESRDQVTVAAKPVFWDDVDLHAWQPLQYSPIPEYENQPLTINRPDSPLDLNNIAYNTLTVADWSVFRLLDDVVSPLSGGERNITSAIERADADLRHGRDWVAEGAQALDVPEVAVSDYQPGSLGNLKRLSGLIDWMQNRLHKRNHGLGQRSRTAHDDRRETVADRLVHGPVDLSQATFWEVYRFAQRMLIEILDERILNGIEDKTDRMLNSFRAQPDEVIVPELENE